MVAKAIIITGSREWDEQSAIWKVIQQQPMDTVFIHGACTSGAGPIAECFLSVNRRSTIAMPAKWEQYGLGAGPRRNRFMLHVL